MCIWTTPYISTTLLFADAEDRAMLESNLSAVIGDDVALGRVTWLCPERLNNCYIVRKAINSLTHLC